MNPFGQLVRNSHILKSGIKWQVREINIVLHYHEITKDSTVIINGDVHRHVTSKTAEELVEYTVMASEQAELETAEPGNEDSGGSGLPN